MPQISLTVKPVLRGSGTVQVQADSVQTVEVDDEVTVQQLTDQACSQFPIDKAGGIRILYKGSVLRSEDTLRAAGLRSGSIVILFGSAKRPADSPEDTAAAIPHPGPHEAWRAWGITIQEFQSLILGMGFDLDIGFTGSLGNAAVARIETPKDPKDPSKFFKSKPEDRMNGYHFVEGLRALLFGDSHVPEGLEVPVFLSDPPRQVTLQAGKYMGKSMLEALGICKKADVFVSHAQSEVLKFTLDAMANYTASDGKQKIRFWIDYVSLRHSEGFGQALHFLPEVMKTIGGFALIVHPWQSPDALSRLWCNFEVGAATNKGLDVVALLTPAGEKSFIECFQDDPRQIMNEVCRIDIKTAKWSREKWRVLVHGEIERGLGFLKTNQLVVSSIWRSLIAVAFSHVEDTKINSSTMSGRTMLTGNLGLLLLERGMLQEAERLFLDALQADEIVFGPGHWRVAIACNDLGLVYRFQRRTELAEETYYRAIRILEELEDSMKASSYPALSMLYSNLGLVLWEDREDDPLKGKVAGSMFQKALAISERFLGEDHGHTAMFCNNMGLFCHYEQKAWLEAESFFVRAVKIDERTDMKDHPEHAAHLNNLGLLYRKAEFLMELPESERPGKLEESYKHLTRALEIREKALGSNNFFVSEAYTNLGLLHAWQSKACENPYLDFGRARELLRKALKIKQSGLRPGHPMIGMALQTYAIQMYDMGDYGQAEEYAVESVKIFAKAHGPHHDTTVMAYQGLRLVWSKLGIPPMSLHSLLRHFFEHFPELYAAP